ncbi:MAG TPA: hypothetical protein VK106_05400, partial [Balneolaceae bacterium]|nr:hypothetical protein [Balneolaceae bacterium]
MKRGHRATFWASTFKHNVKKQRYERETILHPEQNLTLRFLKSKPYSKNISFKRLLSHRNYANTIIDAFDRQDDLPDIIMLAFPPIKLADSISAWSNKHDIPCIVDIIDPWPDVFAKHLNYLPGLVFTPLQRSVSKMMKRVSAVTAISNQYIEWAKDYNPHLQQTKCFYPAVQFKQIQKEITIARQKVDKDPDSFEVIYAGSLGYLYDISTILEAAAVLED